MSKKSHFRPPQPQQQKQELQVVQQLYQGPLPPASELEKYNRLFDGCAERIVAMAEKNQAHRHELESKVVTGNVTAQRQGTIFAFVLSVLMILIGGGLIAFDKPVQGLGLIVGNVVTLAGIFIYSKQSQNKQRDKRRAESVAPSAPQVADSNRA